MQKCSLTLLNCDGQFIQGGRIKLSLLLQVLLLYRFKSENTEGHWKKDHFCHMVQIISDLSLLSFLLLLGHSILLCVSFPCDGILEFICWLEIHIIQFLQYVEVTAIIKPESNSFSSSTGIPVGCTLWPFSWRGGRCYFVICSSH